MSRPARETAHARKSRETRRKIVRAAHRLFIDGGFLGTPITEIAREAGVAPQTVYFVFGNKLSILQEVLDVAVAGDDAPVPVLERPWIDELRAATTPAEAANLLAVHAGGIVARAAPVYRALLRSAGDHDVEALLEENKRRRSESMDVMAGIVCDAGLLPVSRKAHFGDVLYGLIGEEGYMLLVEERGWSTERWIEWARAVLEWELTRS